jgi:hypothetical protein
MSDRVPDAALDLRELLATLHRHAVEYTGRSRASTT